MGACVRGHRSHHRSVLQFFWVRQRVTVKKNATLFRTADTGVITCRLLRSKDLALSTPAFSPAFVPHFGIDLPLLKPSADHPSCQSVSENKHHSLLKDNMSDAALPPFPDDVPTVPLLVIDYARLRAGDEHEIDRLWQAATQLGFW